jgi:hypothetical protein
MKAQLAGSGTAVMDVIVPKKKLRSKVSPFIPITSKSCWSRDTGRSAESKAVPVLS